MGGRFLQALADVPGGGLEVARPTKLTAERQRIITEMIAAGHTFGAACSAADVDCSTYRRWALRGQREAGTRYAGFCAALTRAENDAEMRHVEVIEAAVDAKDWRAAGWWLERRRSRDWGRQGRVDLVVTLEDEARRLAAELGVPVEVALEEARMLLLEASRR